MLPVLGVGQNYILNLVINMAKRKNNFYIGKGKEDSKPWLFYGSTPPCFVNDEICASYGCKLVSSFTDNPIADSIKDNEIIKVYIRKETIKTNKDENKNK